MNNVLIIRLSAIGDVAMTIPVIYSVARKYPDSKFTVVTKTFLIDLFINKPSNIDVVGVDTVNEHKSVLKLLKFSFKKSKRRFDAVVDLHKTIRSRIISSLIIAKGVPVYFIRKGRHDRKSLTSQKNKKLRELMHMTERYANVFHRAGFEFKVDFNGLYEGCPPDLSFINLDDYAGRKIIGIAPFAKHKGKIYPPEKMEAVIKELTSDNNNLILLFGGKGDEAAKLNEWENSFPNVINVAGKFTLSQELAIISKLDLLVCMDSANMHFASLVNTKCVSVWGATHPYMGFLGYGQSMKNCVGVDMPCRPCSVFGQKPCQRNDYACLGFIKTENIIEKINNNLK